jgi:hypothetical protein
MGNRICLDDGGVDRLVAHMTNFEKARLRGLLKKVVVFGRGHRPIRRRRTRTRATSLSTSYATCGSTGFQPVRFFLTPREIDPLW